MAAVVGIVSGRDVSIHTHCGMKYSYYFEIVSNVTFLVS